MAGEVKGSREPTPGLNIELTSTSFFNFGNSPLKGLGIYGDSISHGSEIGDIEDETPQIGDGPRMAARVYEAIDGCSLPEEDKEESEGPDDGEKPCGCV